MDIQNSRVLVLGGAGLVGTAVCRELLTRQPAEIRIHSRREETATAASAGLTDAGDTVVSTSSGDMFGLAEAASGRDQIKADLLPLKQQPLDQFLLFRLLTEFRPDVVIDCVNTATAIAYRDLFRASQRTLNMLETDELDSAQVEELLEALYIPRLVRHLQVLYQGMQQAKTREYIKVGTTGTGGMGLNIPYTHSEERPSRMLLSKSAVAGAQTMLLFLMARTPGAPITREIKPAAAIGWKRIAHGPIYRRGEPVRCVDAHPVALGATISTVDPSAAHEHDRLLESVFIDTGENGVFSLEEFSALTTARQMEFVTPEEIAQQVVLELEGNTTGHDVLSALEHSVMAPSYRAGLMRHWALEHMGELEKQHGVHSVAFEMLGPPRVSKLLFEAHLLRLALGTMSAVRKSTAAGLMKELDDLVRTHADAANDIVAIGIPILLPSGELIRGPRILVPSEADNEQVTTTRIDEWAQNGWVDLREGNCATWIRRFTQIREETQQIPQDDTSSRFLRNHRFWNEQDEIQPGKVVGWILTEEEHGDRIKE